VASSEIQRRGSCGSCAGEKTDCGACGRSQRTFYDCKTVAYATFLWRHPGVPGVRGATRLLSELRHREAGASAVVGNNPFYTKRFGFYVGRRCRASTIQDVARELRSIANGQGAGDGVHARAAPTSGTPGPKVLGIDELSVGRGQNYRIIVSDLVRGRPIWFEVQTDPRRAWISSSSGWAAEMQRNPPGRHGHVEAVRKSTLKAGNAPRARILYDKFHILKKLNEHWTRFVRASTPGSRERIGDSSRARSTHCCPAGPI